MPENVRKLFLEKRSAYVELSNISVATFNSLMELNVRTEIANYWKNLVLKHNFTRRRKMMKFI